MPSIRPWLPWKFHIRQNASPDDKPNQLPEIQLCRKCHKALASSWSVRQIPKEDRTLSSKHQDSAAGLVKAAWKGCHVCKSILPDVSLLYQSFVADFNKLYRFETTYDISKGDLVGIAIEFKVRHSDAESDLNDIDLVLEH